MQIWQALEILGHLDQRDNFCHIVLPQEKLGEGFTTSLGTACYPDDMFDIWEVAEFGVGKANGVGEAFHGIIGEGIIWTGERECV